MTTQHTFDPTRDLVLERTVDLAPEQIWQAWTTPELLEQWFTPKPWRTTDVVVDLRPGGEFTTTMRGPEGEEFTGTGCFLEVVPNEKLVWTSALVADYHPAAPSEDPSTFYFTAIITLSPEGNGTHYRCVAAHATEAAKQQHGEMGFEVGWGAAFDQLVELMKSR